VTKYPKVPRFATANPLRGATRQKAPQPGRARLGRPQGPRALRTVAAKVLEPWQRPPAWWLPPRSAGEWAVWWTLQYVHRLVPDRDFFYQRPYAGGRLVVGGFVPDYLLPSYFVAINVDSIYYHATRGTAQQALDLAQTAMLAGQGVSLIHLWEDDLLRDPRPLVRQALQGIQPPQPV
jgi:hypothetical protein